MATTGQRYKDPKSGLEYEYTGGDRWKLVSPVSGGRTGGGGANVSSFQLGYTDPASTPVTNPLPTSTPNINSASGSQNPANQTLTQMATPAKTEVSREDLGGGKVRIRYSDGSVQIKNPGRAQGASVAPAPTPMAPGPGGAPAQREEGPANGGIVTTVAPTKPGTSTTPQPAVTNTGQIPDDILKKYTKEDIAAFSIGSKPIPPELAGYDITNADVIRNSKLTTGSQFATPTPNPTPGAVTAGTGAGAGTGTATQTFTEGQTRGQGAEIYRNGQWVANTPPPPANPPAPLPSTVNPTETLIAPQNDNNPVSNAMAIQRAAAAENPAFQFSSADIAKESEGLGLSPYIPTQQMMDEAVRLYEQQADADYQGAEFDLRNRYGGAGIGGGRVLDSARLAREYALGKATGGRNLRNQMMGEGFNRSLSALGMGGDVLRNRQALGEGRYNTAVNAALNQNALQTGLVQQERQREWQAQQNQAQRIHDAATAQSLANQQGRASILAGVLPTLMESVFPEGDTPEDAYYRAQTEKILREAGVDPTKYTGADGGFDWQQFLNPANILQMLGVDL